ncbi:molybdopterin biosynthesis protein [Desulfatitalea alkaliphila]|uniref:Molybdopterin molybdenumtransferase n=1 Tax=Desulfatitalea alkaliphila TaxID=2929485 RepID=A0AA41R351_9BACT|nr:molybdopterin biosynthesis protein [Desulfatitalea alkaliphila]
MSPKRNIYLQMKSLAEARRIVLDAFGDNPLGTETVATADAVGRVLAAPVTARFSSPGYHAAAMDGIAVNAKHTFGAHPDRPKQLAVGREAFPVNTGHLLPPGTDAVIMIEHVQTVDAEHIQIEAPAYPWQHVRKMGEDIVATEMLFARLQPITPYCVGALLAAGLFEVPVLARPRVAVIPTGAELVDWQRLGPTEAPAPGCIIESNSYLLGALVQAAGGTFQRHDPVGDDVQRIGDAVAVAVAEGAHMVLLVGGSSAGSEDFARATLEARGEILVHGVTMMPGKPTIAASLAGTPVFGMPGYPVSTIMAFEQLVQPLMTRMLGQLPEQRPTMQVVPTRKMASKLGVEEFVRVKIGQVGERRVATALPRGAGQITSITEADGIIRIPANSEGVGPDGAVTAELLKPAAAISNTIVVVGSHDNTLDLLADELRAQSAHLSLSSSHVGSMGGLMAVKRGVCHMAGTHLLDEATGSYNLSYIQRYLPDVPVRLVHLVMRDQGLIVPAGNPKGIKGIEDLAREEVRFINRQGGSGTRILLDYRLKQLDMDPATIAGYATEEFTHMAVAAAVLSGAADVGLGIHAAARALGLDFIPVVTEQYDLLVTQAHFDTPAVQSLLAVINSSRFKQRVASLGGYHTERTGELLL